MKELNEQPITSCDDVELLLSKRLVDKLTGDEEQIWHMPESMDQAKDQAGSQRAIASL